MIDDPAAVERIRARYAAMIDELDELREAGDGQGWDRLKTDLDEEAFDLLGELLREVGPVP